MSELETILRSLFAVIVERVKYLKEMSEELPTFLSFKRADHKYKSAIERDLQVAIEACTEVSDIDLAIYTKAGFKWEDYYCLYGKLTISERLQCL